MPYIARHKPRIVVDMYRAAKRRGKYIYYSSPTLRWIIVVVYTKPVDSQHQIVPIFLRNEEKTHAQNPQKCREANSGYYPEFE